MLSDLDKKYPILLVLTIFLGLIVFFWGLGSIELMSLNEGRRALATKEMVTTGNWFLPHLNGELYLTKPPLLYWVSSTLAIIWGGVNEWTLRLPSALAAIAILWMTYLYAFKQSGKWAALFAIQLLIANVSFVMLGRRAEIEMLLTALCIGSLLSALQYIQLQSNKIWIYLSYFLLALALMAKGPLVLLFVTLPLIVAAIYTKDSSIKTVLLSWRGWLIFLVVGLAWYVLVTWQLGFDIWASIAKKDMLDKMQGSSAKPILSYIGWIAVDFMLLVGLFFVRTEGSFKKQTQKIDQLVLIVAIIVPLVIFSIFTNKHAKYLLPIYPLIAILLGLKLNEIFETAKISLKKVFVILGLLLVIGFAVFYALIEPKAYAYRVVAFPSFANWSSNVNQSNLYAYNNVDSRLIYYANKPIKVLDKPMVVEKKNSQTPFLLLVESDDLHQIELLADCKIKEFSPYLKKNKTLIVFGFGSACPHI